MAQEKKSAEALQLVVSELSKEEYGIPITQIQEIIKIPEITRIPNMPDFIEGVINLRGKIIPIIDLRKRFRLDQKQKDEETRIVIANIGGQPIGLISDSVSEVIRLSQEDIDPVPPIISHINSEYLSGVGKMDKRIIILLNLEKILSDLEKSSLRKIEKEIAADLNT
ncbi:MAG: chemotaxis protein CheW [Elusimicrobia bacterium RIFOXYA1_FULL_47_7]|nr:MAG: chemotaxis protein CheW [Elusimicrobia bacterium RIFOXYA12_FULL_49_49]OGS07858.1 MAG: chemotaxis protein CheW [Elusimicrobia bacterium RIFOXYA1_FULL_47_7]OGS16457.1 MAG: chemotaxis protein CheW [Elusimicrobia bacterium RIFOXYA2_FULL_47_53]OGS26038.1 MAG: chemotaxis protein CheW [Elusimicrobia bacterium RIFOXYB12_FULL_50_12]OGS29655.1 MAG: chemotaxis protein CheW [Elusimicrobia bacterium RIFOXYB2_FULL_46_23]